MFDIGWTELLVIAVVAIVVIGPKDLPRAMRTVGQWTTKVKRMAGDFQRQFNEAVREAELDDVKKEVASLGKLDPMADLKKSLTKVDTDLKADLKKVDDSIAGSLAKPDTVNPVPKVPAPAAAVAAVPVVAAEIAAPEAVVIESAEPAAAVSAAEVKT
jgi:sec-independent protein translocase protein TatB